MSWEIELKFTDFQRDDGVMTMLPYVYTCISSKSHETTSWLHLSQCSLLPSAPRCSNNQQQPSWVYHLYLYLPHAFFFVFWRYTRIIVWSIFVFICVYRCQPPVHPSPAPSEVPHCHKRQRSASSSIVSHWSSLLFSLAHLLCEWRTPAKNPPKFLIVANDSAQPHLRVVSHWSSRLFSLAHLLCKLCTPAKTQIRTPGNIARGNPGGFPRQNRVGLWWSCWLLTNRFVLFTSFTAAPPLPACLWVRNRGS